MIILLKLRRARGDHLQVQMSPEWSICTYALLRDIQALLEKQNDLSLIEMYQMIERANQELEVRYE